MAPATRPARRPCDAAEFGVRGLNNFRLRTLHEIDLVSGKTLMRSAHSLSGPSSKHAHRPRGVRAGGRAAILMAAAVAVTGLAAAPAFANTAQDEASAPDPYEKMNRVFFYANGALDFLVIRPVSIGYKRIMPRPIRTGLRNAFSNMGEPTVAMNDIFQGHGKKAVHTVARLAMNSTVGLGGLIDVASVNGLPHHDNDFGITLAKRGVHSGAYLFLPVIGPGTVRDAVGYLVNIGLDPFTYVRFTGSTPLGYARFVGRGLDERASSDKNIKTIMASSTDPYASIRSYYLQNREGQIAGGKVDINALPSFDEGPAKPQGTPPSAPPSASEPAPQPAPQ